MIGIIEEQSGNFHVIPCADKARRITLHHHLFRRHGILQHTCRQKVVGITHYLELPCGVEIRAVKLHRHVAVGIPFQIGHEESKRHLHRTKLHLLTGSGSTISIDNLTLFQHGFIRRHIYRIRCRGCQIERSGLNSNQHLFRFCTLLLDVIDPSYHHSC